MKWQFNYVLIKFQKYTNNNIVIIGSNTMCLKVSRLYYYIGYHSIDELSLLTFKNY